eukprot:jgi/Ulvmu1/11274/UM073_0046.1
MPKESDEQEWHEAQTPCVIRQLAATHQELQPLTPAHLRATSDGMPAVLPEHFMEHSRTTPGCPTQTLLRMLNAQSAAVGGLQGLQDTNRPSADADPPFQQSPHHSVATIPVTFAQSGRQAEPVTEVPGLRHPPQHQQPTDPVEGGHEPGDVRDTSGAGDAGLPEVEQGPAELIAGTALAPVITTRRSVGSQGDSIDRQLRQFLSNPYDASPPGSPASEGSPHCGTGRAELAAPTQHSGGGDMQALPRSTSHAATEAGAAAAAPQPAPFVPNGTGAFETEDDAVVVAAVMCDDGYPWGAEEPGCTGGHGSGGHRPVYASQPGGQDLTGTGSADAPWRDAPWRAALVPDMHPAPLQHYGHNADWQCADDAGRQRSRWGEERQLPPQLRVSGTPHLDWVLESDRAAAARQAWCMHMYTNMLPPGTWPDLPAADTPGASSTPAATRARRPVPTTPSTPQHTDRSHYAGGSRPPADRDADMGPTAAPPTPATSDAPQPRCRHAVRVRRRLPQTSETHERCTEHPAAPSHDPAPPVDAMHADNCSVHGGNPASAEHTQHAALPSTQATCDTIGIMQHSMVAVPGPLPLPYEPVLDQQDGTDASGHNLDNVPPWQPLQQQAALQQHHRRLQEFLDLFAGVGEPDLDAPRSAAAAPGLVPAEPLEEAGSLSSGTTSSSSGSNSMQSTAGSLPSTSPTASGAAPASQHPGHRFFFGN